MEPVQRWIDYEKQLLLDGSASRRCQRETRWCLTVWCPRLKSPLRYCAGIASLAFNTAAPSVLRTNLRKAATFVDGDALVTR